MAGGIRHKPPSRRGVGRRGGERPRRRGCQRRGRRTPKRSLEEACKQEAQKERRGWRWDTAGRGGKAKRAACQVGEKTSGGSIQSSGKKDFPTFRLIYIYISVVSKGRSGSRQLNRVLKRIGAYLLAFGLHLVVAHVDSLDSPSGKGSRVW